jgi:hypothetical protein
MGFAQKVEIDAARRLSTIVTDFQLRRLSSSSSQRDFLCKADGMEQLVNSTYKCNRTLFEKKSNCNRHYVNNDCTLKADESNQLVTHSMRNRER